MTSTRDDPAGAESPTRRRGLLGPRTVVAGAVLAVVAATGGLVSLADRDAPNPVRPPASRAASSSPVVDADQQQVDALTALLDARGAAVLSGDRSRWLGTIDPQSGSFLATQRAVFDNLTQVPFGQWTYQFTGRAPELSRERLRQLGGPAWVARVLAGYRLKGYDRTTSFTEQYLTVVRRADRWYLAATSDGGTAPQPWDLGKVDVVRGERVIVLGTAKAATLEAYAVAGDRAVGRVSEVWGSDWPRRAVLVAPSTQDEFGRLLLRGKDGLGQVAAVTTGDLGGDLGSSDAPNFGDAPTSAAGAGSGNDRVVINPSAFARLGATGRRVVLTHEMTHVAVRSRTSAAVPIWLSEGFADFVGYRGSGVSRAAGAGDLLALVREGSGPKSLPVAADFDPTRTTIAPSYSASWLACALIADTYGTQKLVALYRKAGTARGDAASVDPDVQLAKAFPVVLGTTEAAFTKRWRAYLADLARS